MDAVEMLLKFVPRARSVSSVATKLGGARVAEPHRAMANPLGMDACKINLPPGTTQDLLFIKH
jgi:hypothetical protein